MCSCMVCEVCLERLHKKHDLRRQVNDLKRQIRVEYRPEIAAYVRKQAASLQRMYEAL